MLIVMIMIIIKRGREKKDKTCLARSGLSGFWLLSERRVGVPDDGSLNDDRLVVREEDDDLPARYLLEKLSGLLWDARLANMAKAMNQSLRSSAFSVRPSTFFDRGQDLLSNKPGCQNCSQPDPNQPN
jgi:hypothetical protein